MQQAVIMQKAAREKGVKLGLYMGSLPKRKAENIRILSFDHLFFNEHDTSLPTTKIT